MSKFEFSNLILVRGPSRLLFKHFIFLNETIRDSVFINFK